MRKEAELRRTPAHATFMYDVGCLEAALQSRKGLVIRKAVGGRRRVGEGQREERGETRLGWREGLDMRTVAATLDSAVPLISIVSAISVLGANSPPLIGR